MLFSPIIIGTMRWGTWGANFTPKQTAELINICIENYLTTFDHADIYGNYTTEKLFGEAFSSMKIERQNVQFISKCGIELPGGGKNFKVKAYNYSKKYILQQAEKSLKNLQTDYLDVLLLHRPSPLMDPEEISAAFGILRSEGKVLNFGVSNFSVAQFDLISEYFPYLITNQIEISLTETKAFSDGTLDQMMAKRLHPMAYSVMGNYFSEPVTAQNIRIKKAVLPLCEKYNCEENQILLAFLLKHPAKILPVAGTSKKENILKFKEALDINLDRSDWFLLLEAARGKVVD